MNHEFDQRKIFNIGLCQDDGYPIIVIAGCNGKTALQTDKLNSKALFLKT